MFQKSAWPDLFRRGLRNCTVQKLLLGLLLTAFFPAFVWKWRRLYANRQAERAEAAEGWASKDAEDAKANIWNERYKTCRSRPEPFKEPVLDGITNKVLYLVTPTYARSEQTAELTRLSQTVTLASQRGQIHWIVVEDAEKCSQRVQQMLEGIFKSPTPRPTNLTFTLLAAKMPNRYRKSSVGGGVGVGVGSNVLQEGAIPRGVAGRRAAVNWVLKHTNSSSPGVLYFADDDNTYDLRLFDELRKTRAVSVFPVGLIQPVGISAPVLNLQGRVIGFATGRKRPSRRFPLDMAGFAVSIGLLHQKTPEMPYKATQEEDGFLRSMNLSYSQLEPLAWNCTEILVWHTQTFSPKARRLKRPGYFGSANMDGLFDHLIKVGVAQEDERRGKQLQMCIGTECAN